MIDHLDEVNDMGTLPGAWGDIPLSQSLPGSLFCPCTAGKAAVFILAPGDLSPGLAESRLWPWKLAGAPGTVLSFLFHLEMFIIPLPGQLLPCGKAVSGSARCGRSSLWAHRAPAGDTFAAFHQKS